MNKLQKIIEKIIFGSKYILVVFYLGLIAAVLIYGWQFILEIYELTHHFTTLTHADFMLTMLTLLDTSMIANLILSNIGGSYKIFVNRGSAPTEKVSSGTLKIKLSISILGIALIYLLKEFIDVKDIYVKGGIFLLFLICTIILAWVEYLHVKTDLLLAETQKRESINEKYKSDKTDNNH